MLKAGLVERNIIIFIIHSFICPSCIHSFSSYSLCVCWLPGTVCGTGIKSEQDIPCSEGIHKYSMHLSNHLSDAHQVPDTVPIGSHTLLSIPIHISIAWQIIFIPIFWMSKLRSKKAKWLAPSHVDAK